MRTLILAVCIASLPTGIQAQSFQPDRQGFVWKQGKEYVRFHRGRWSAGIEGAASVGWHMFLWHDKWIYETLPGGKIASGPTLHSDGSLTMSGAFSARENSAPMKYAYRIVPEKQGVRVRCELEKTGPLQLPNGVWLHVSGNRPSFHGSERVWARPCAHGTIGSTLNSNAEKFFVELLGGRSLTLSVPGYHEVGSEGSRGSYTFRYNLLRGDFDVGQKAVIEYTIGFGDMPQEFPGDIRPLKKPLAIGSVRPSPARVARYEKLELAVDLGATYDNPFDPDDVRLDAVFTAPSGKETIVPGFFAVACRRQVIEGTEVMTPEDNGRWLVRFAPQEAGQYTWRLKLKDRTGETAGGAGRFEAEAAKTPGFLRQSKADPHYLAFDNGQGFFAVGHNLPIYHTSGQLGDEAMRRFAAGRENFNRWWMSSSGFGIEWMDRLGWYRQDAAARIDLVLDVARELGLYYMMCMDTHQDFREGGWERNPFNAKNGGPCQKAGDWFTNEEARKLYKKRLRYTVARWGYSPHVLAWEFGNEFEGWADSPDAIKLPWHKEMSDYLRSIDPHRHLITTSFWSHTGPEAYWKLDNIDIVQTHCYTNDDGNVAEPVRRYCLHQWEKFQKPHIFGEFGIRSHSSTADKDPEGWGIHNALWAGLFNFSAGGPMPWWHESYIDKLDLYFHFASLANFTQGLPLGTARWEPLKLDAIQYVDQNRKPETRDAVVMPSSRWGKPEHNEFVVQSDGTIAGERLPQRLLHGGGHRDLKNEPTFVVRYAQAGKFIVRVGRVSNSGLLRVWIDGRQVLEKELPCGQGLGKESVFRPQWKLWETTYDQDVAVDVPAGEHRIRIENFGRDWVTVTRYTFTGCLVLDRPNVLACGMKTAGLAMLWLENRDSSWYNHAGNGKVGRVDPFQVALGGLPDGKCRIEWWTTWKSRLQREEQAEVKSGKLMLTVPPLETDVAVKIRMGVGD